MRIFIALCLSAIWSSAVACDVCGCSASSFNSGLLNLSNSHFIGLSYKTRFFESTHPSVFAGEVPTVSREKFQSLEISGRWMPHKNLQIMGALPYNFLYINESDVVEKNQGVGDASVLVQGVISNAKDSGNFSYRIAAGAGLKAPTGNSSRTSSAYGMVIPNMQLGTGSWDWIFNANAVLRYKKWYSAIDLSYNLNGVNSLDYKFGNRRGAQAAFGRWINIGNSTIVLRPEIGAQLVSAKYDYDGYSLGATNEYSHGYFLDIAPSVQFQNKKWSLKVTAQTPIAQDFANGYVSSKWSMNARLFYLIPTRK